MAMILDLFGHDNPTSKGRIFIEDIFVYSDFSHDRMKSDTKFFVIGRYIEKSLLCVKDKS